MKLKIKVALIGNASQSYGASPAIWDHTVSCHPLQVNAPSYTGWYSVVRLLA